MKPHILAFSNLLLAPKRTHQLFPSAKYVPVKLDDKSTANVNINSLEELHELIFSQIPHGSIGYGGYLEQRNIYHQNQTVAYYATSTGELRSVHLAMDFWVMAGTPVYSVWNGTIHSVAYRPITGQFGGCIVTQHEWGGETVHLLYGHLSEQSVHRFTKGQTISAGEKLGKIGMPAENGEWPPHLHFQVIRDMMGLEGDFYGVAAPSDLEFFMYNCPDPNLILNINSKIRF